MSSYTKNITERVELGNMSIDYPLQCQHKSLLELLRAPIHNIIV